MIKNYLLILSAWILVLGSCTNSGNKQAQSNQDSTIRNPIDQPEEVQQISEVITRFVRAYLSQDNNKINALIHPQHGIAVIFRPGAMDEFQVVDSLDFANSIPESYPYPSFKNDHVLSFQNLPEYDCGTEKWDKLGFFCDTTQSSVSHQLQTIFNFQQEFNQTKYPEETKQQITALQDGSFRVILAPEKGTDWLIFHVKQFDNSWYVTILDRAYGDCSA